MLNLYVADDPRQHMCEVQVAHNSMLVARKGLPGHQVYNRVRNATEMNEFLGVDGEQGRGSRLRELRAQGDPIASTAELLRLGCKPQTLIASGCSQEELEQARCIHALVIAARVLIATTPRAKLASHGGAGGRGRGSLLPNAARFAASGGRQERERAGLRGAREVVRQAPPQARRARHCGTPALQQPPRAGEAYISPISHLNR